MLHTILAFLRCASHHCSFSQRARFQAVESLNTKNTIVIATDVAARGLDWTAIPTIVHYDAARTMESFVHRAGRTAVSSLRVVFCSPL